TAEKLFGKVIGQAFQAKNVFRDQVIKMEDPEFEKEFVVYGTDQQQARYVLTPDMMVRIKEIRSKYGSLVRLSFLNSRVFVAISLRKNNFEPRSFGDPLCLDEISKMHDLFSDFVGLVDDLNLNTRIWSKA
ncbi:MAG: DUF3137 domain-containing protein, partial [Pseudomonadota bacterium]